MISMVCLHMEGKDFFKPRGGGGSVPNQFDFLKRQFGIIVKSVIIW